MANWTDVRLTVMLPKANRSAFLAAVRGPSQWSLPSAVHKEFLSFSDREVSSHDKIELIANRESLEREIRSHPAYAHYPEWMPLSIEDAHDFLSDNLIEIPETILSIPRLSPIQGRAEFDKFFPGEIGEAGYWEPVTDLSVHMFIQHLTQGISGLYKSKVGAYSALFEMEFIDMNSPKQGYDVFDFRFQIKNGTVSEFPAILSPVLRQFDAKALHVWEHNAEDGGFDYINPSSDFVLSDSEDAHTIGDHIGMSFEHNEEDEELTEYLDILSVGFWACQTVNDPDFKDLY